MVQANGSASWKNWLLAVLTMAVGGLFAQAYHQIAFNSDRITRLEVEVIHLQQEISRINGRKYPDMLGVP